MKFDDFLDSLSDEKEIKQNQPKKIKEEKDIIDSYELNSDFLKAKDIIQNTSECLLLTGDAGTGKSTFIKKIIKETNKNIILLAPTGVASVNIGGQTIHSFFKFPAKPLTSNYIPIVKQDDLYLFKKIDTIIIDEISMVRVDLMEAIDHFLRTNLTDNRPFAGKQIIMIGDLSQLPPVMGTSEEKNMILNQWDSEFFFSANVLKNLSYNKIYLTKIYRQNDQIFIETLNKIKRNTITEQEIAEINSKCYRRNISYSDIITICSTNASADIINDMELSKIPGERIVLEGKLEGQFNEKSCPVERRITVKKNCKLMMLNNDSEGRWINGTKAVLLDIKNVDGEEHLIVDIDGQEYFVGDKEYETIKYVYDRENHRMSHEVLGKFKQKPVKLAYATTIHKAQGQTYDKLNIEFDRGSFAHGQTYVALSRCRSLEGISLSTPLKKTDIILDKRVEVFLNSIIQL
jgi:ATP-dependent DNA helicase PIF1